MIHQKYSHTANDTIKNVGLVDWQSDTQKKKTLTSYF